MSVTLGVNAVQILEVFVIINMRDPDAPWICEDFKTQNTGKHHIPAKHLKKVQLFDFQNTHP